MPNSTSKSPEFIPALISEKFGQVLARFNNLLTLADKPELASIREKLKTELDEYYQRGFLTVAIIGEYSAGKSTIISALTGKRDIPIGADITTNETVNYDWNGIQLIDTPGLFTERNDHDEITYQAINKADLLVFCLTYMLFDSVTKENFKKLAYEEGYCWKMMLVINKMSDEAGEENERITNYRESLSEALKPYNLDEIPLCFIDAKCHCDGIDENEYFLMEVSRFQTLIDTLNQFVKSQGTLARFDTPVRIALGHIQEAELILLRNSGEDSAFWKILNCLSRTVDKERSRLETKVRGIISRMSSDIVQEGKTLMAAVGKKEFENLNQESEVHLREHYEKAERELQSALNTAVENIHQEVGKVLESHLVQNFIARLDPKQNVSINNLNDDINLEQIKGQVILLKNIGEQAGFQITGWATRGFLRTASGQKLLRSMDVAGSGLHQAVLGVGKFVGFKFKPWQAVNLAKNIGNTAKFLGPALALVGVVVDAVQLHQENKRQQEMADIRREINRVFQGIARNLEKQIQDQLKEFNQQVYSEIEEEISKARKQQENAITVSSRWVKQLAEIRQDFELILRYITKAIE